MALALTTIHMTGKTHLTLGILTAMLTTDDTLQFCCLCIGSILPDIDHPTSMLGKKVPFVAKLFSHRGFTHSLLFSTLMAVIDIWICYGTIVHIVADMLTKQGVALLYPIEKKLRLPLAKYVKTGGMFEKFIFFIINVTILAILYHRISANFNITETCLNQL